MMSVSGGVVKVRRILFGFAGFAVLLGLVGGVWWWRLQPYEREVELVSGAVPPQALTDHCEDAIGEPRVEQVGDDVFVALGFDLANTIVVRTAAGNVVIDPGMNPVRAAETREAVAAYAPGQTAAIIYTHSHVDHVGGASAVDRRGHRDLGNTGLLGSLREAVLGISPHRDGAGRSANTACMSTTTRCPALQSGDEWTSERPSRPACKCRRERSADRTRSTSEASHSTWSRPTAKPTTSCSCTSPPFGVLMPGDNYYRSFPNIYTIRGTAPRARRRLDRLDRCDAPAGAGDADSVAYSAHSRGRTTSWRRLLATATAFSGFATASSSPPNAGESLDGIAESIGLPARLAKDPALGAAVRRARLVGARDLQQSPRLVRWPTRAALPTTEQRSRVARTGHDGRRRARVGRGRARYRGRPALGARIARAASGRRVRSTWRRETLGDRQKRARSKPSPTRSATRMGAATYSSLLTSYATAAKSRRFLSRPTSCSTRFRSDRSSRSWRRGSFPSAVSIPTRAWPSSSPTPTSASWSPCDMAWPRSSKVTPARQPKPVARVTTTTNTWRRLAIGQTGPASAVAAGDLSISEGKQAFYTFSKRFKRGL